MRIRIRESKEDSVIVNNQPMNPVNAFDLSAITNELLRYGIDISILPQRIVKNNLFVIPIDMNYTSKFSRVDDYKHAALVYLYVDYGDNSAYAMCKEGSDKQSMMLIASVANKHIKEPFKYNKKIRTRIL